MPLPGSLKLSSSVNTCFHSTKKGKVKEKIPWDRGANEAYTLEPLTSKDPFPYLGRGFKNMLSWSYIFMQFAKVRYFNSIH